MAAGIGQAEQAQAASSLDIEALQEVLARALSTFQEELQQGLCKELRRCFERCWDERELLTEAGGGPSPQRSRNGLAAGVLEVSASIRKSRINMDGLGTQDDNSPKVRKSYTRSSSDDRGAGGQGAVEDDKKGDQSIRKSIAWAADVSGQDDDDLFRPLKRGGSNDEKARLSLKRKTAEEKQGSAGSTVAVNAPSVAMVVPVPTVPAPPLEATDCDVDSAVKRANAATTESGTVYLGGSPKGRNAPTSTEGKYDLPGSLQAKSRSPSPPSPSPSAGGETMHLRVPDVGCVGHKRSSLSSRSSGRSGASGEDGAAPSASHPLWAGMFSGDASINAIRESRREERRDSYLSKTSDCFAGRTSRLPAGRNTQTSSGGGLQDEVFGEISATGWWLYLQRVVVSPRFENFSGLCIVLNAICLGVHAQYSISNIGSEIPPLLSAFEAVFSVIFAIELSLRLVAYGSDFWTLEKEWSWNVLDAIVISAQISDTVIMAAVPRWQGFPGTFALVRMLRIPRLIRVVSVVRMMSMVQELRTMVHSISNAIRSLASTMILLLILMYTISVYVLSLVASQARDRPWIMEGDKSLGAFYGSLWRTLLTLFQASTSGLDWNDILKPLMEEISPLMAIPITLYIAFTLLAMMNVITGVFVETALSSARASKDKELRYKMRDLFLRTDQDQSGMITWEEFAGMLEDPDMARCFKLLDIDLCEAKGLFTLLDTDCSGEIDAEEFVMGCLRLQGTAKAIDLATLMYFNKRISNWWQEQMGIVRSSLGEINGRLIELDDSVAGLAGPTSSSRANDSSGGPPGAGAGPQAAGNSSAEQPPHASERSSAGGAGQAGPERPGPPPAGRRSMMAGFPSTGRFGEGEGRNSVSSEQSMQSLASFATWAGLKADAGSGAPFARMNKRRSTLQHQHLSGFHTKNGEGGSLAFPGLKGLQEAAASAAASSLSKNAGGGGGGGSEETTERRTSQSNVAPSSSDRTRMSVVARRASRALTTPGGGSLTAVTPVAPAGPAPGGE